MSEIIEQQNIILEAAHSYIRKMPASSQTENILKQLDKLLKPKKKPTLTELELKMSQLISEMETRSAQMGIFDQINIIVLRSDTTIGELLNGENLR